MSDRKLLELAAKAVNGGGWDPLTHDTPDGRPWNPLADDGDALRLAVRLNLTIKIMGDHVKVGWQGLGERWIGEDVPCEAERVMPIATRRAIVRAAAAIAQQRGSGEGGA